MNLTKLNRTSRRSYGLRAPLTHKGLTATAIRIPNLRRTKQKATYEVKLSNKTEHVFHKWDDLIAFMQFPAERGPELFTACFSNRGEWVEFTDEMTDEDDSAMNTPLLYECSVCGKGSQVSPLQSVVTNCECGGTWQLVDIEQYKEALPSERVTKKSYDI